MSAKSMQLLVGRLEQSRLAVTTSMPDRSDGVDDEAGRQFEPGVIRASPVGQGPPRYMRPAGRPGCAMDRAVDTSAVGQGFVRGIDYRVDDLLGDVPCTKSSMIIHRTSALRCAVPSAGEHHNDQEEVPVPQRGHNADHRHRPGLDRRHLPAVRAISARRRRGPDPGYVHHVDSSVEGWAYFQQLILAPISGIYGLFNPETEFVDTETVGFVFGQVGVIVFIMAIGAFISVSFYTGRSTWRWPVWLYKLRSKGWLLITAVMVLFSLLGSTMGFSVETLGFTRCSFR